MNRSQVKLVLVLAILWLGTFFLVASHVNVKGYNSESEQTFFTDSRGYNFEYKQGFPTPWYSRYYRLTDKSLTKRYEGNIQSTCGIFDMSCSKVVTPPSDTLVWQDKSFNVLALQAMLTLIPVILIALIYYILEKYAHHRH